MEIIKIIKENQIKSAIIIILAAFFFSHLYGITDPPNGFHAWRESDTAAVAEAFYKETKNIFKPRIHQREDKIGVTGMEFPIYNYTVAMLYHITGMHHYIPRMLSILFGLLGIAGTFYLGRLLFNKTAGVWAALFMSLSPLYFFYSRKIQPDIVMASVIIWSFYFFILSVQRRANKHLVLSLLLLITGALIKPTALAIGLPMVVLLIFNSKFKQVFQLKYLLFLVFAVGIPVIWNQYAKYLQTEYGLEAFYLGGDIISYWANTDWSAFFSRIFMSWLFELFLGTPVAVGLIIGIIVSRKITVEIKLLIAWVAGCYIMFFIVANHMSNFHDYYGLIVIAPLSLLSSYYIPPLLKHHRSYIQIVAYIVIIASLVYVWPRVDQRYENFNEKDFSNRRELINKYIPAKSRITIEDNTPAIELYRAGRTGWRFRSNDPDTIILEHSERGAEYAVFFKRKISEKLKEYVKILYSDGKIMICKFG